MACHQRPANGIKNASCHGPFAEDAQERATKCRYTQKMLTTAKTNGGKNWDRITYYVIFNTKAPFPCFYIDLRRSIMPKS